MYSVANDMKLYSVIRSSRDFVEIVLWSMEHQLLLISIKKCSSIAYTMNSLA